MAEGLVRFDVDGEVYYLTPDQADHYRRLFDEQSERYKDVLEGAAIEVEPIALTPNAERSLDEHLAQIEAEGKSEQRRWSR